MLQSKLCKQVGVTYRNYRRAVAVTTGAKTSQLQFKVAQQHFGREGFVKTALLCALLWELVCPLITAVVVTFQLRSDSGADLDREPAVCE